MNYVIIDFETANMQRGSACAVGLVRIVDNHPVDKFYSRINPQCVFSKKCIDIHGITSDQVEHAPVFAEIADSIFNFIGSDIVVAHNAIFDMSVLEQSCFDSGINCPDLKYLCSLELSRSVFPDFQKHNLPFLSEQFNYQYQAHNALEDCMAVHNLMRRMSDHIGAQRLSDLIALTGVCFQSIKTDNYIPSSGQASASFIQPAAIEKAINTLHGLVQGMEADQVVNPAEVQELLNWCALHIDWKDKHPFNELFPVIESALEDMVLSEDEIEDICYLCKSLSPKSERFTYVVSKMQQLMGIIHGVLSDCQLNDSELMYLNEWVQDNQELKGIYPFDELETLLITILNDGKIDQEERDSLYAFLTQFVNASESYNLDENEINRLREEFSSYCVCATDPIIKVPGHLFCVTGESSRVSRKEMEVSIEEHGGKVKSSVTKNTDYLVVGDRGSSAWAFTMHGRKIEKAMEMRRKGINVTIVKESDFWDCDDMME